MFDRINVCIFISLILLATPGLAQDGSENDQSKEVNQVISYANKEAKLSLFQVSERTVEIVLAPINADGNPIQTTDSNVLVDYTREPIWSGRMIDGSVQKKVGNLIVTIQNFPLKVTITQPNGTIIQELSWADNGAINFRTESQVFGLGHGGPQFDRRGHVFPMEDGWGAYKRPTHGSRVATPMLIGADGWSMFVHQPISRGNEFDLRGGQGLFLPADEALSQPVRLFVTAWEEPVQALSEYIDLTGKTPMAPKWALGYMQSHRTLENAEKVEEVAQNFRDKNLPADALIYLGTGFTPKGWNRGHGSFKFNKQIFPNPDQQLDELKDLNFKTVLHTYNPPIGLYGTEINTTSQDSNHISSYWDLHEPLYESGVDAWWPDGGEELSAESRVTRHLMYWLGQLSNRPDVRPWSLHRSGYSGIHRYGGWMWSGDVDSYWNTLEKQISVGLNHSVSLSPFWGSDTGGFFSSTEFTGELYIRWFQFSAFTPSFRSHGRAWRLRLPWGWNTGELGPNEDSFENGYPNPKELRNGLIEPIARQYLNLRYRLLPYNYTLLRETHDTGLPPMRAMWLHYPDDPKAIGLGDQYMWGRDLLVAPIYTKGANDRSTYLPKGVWYDFWTNEVYRGGKDITRQVDLATLPLFVRAGAIIPFDPLRQYTNQPVSAPTTIRIYPGTDGSFRWYQDDGISLNYQDGEYSWTLIHWDDSTQTLTIESDPNSNGENPDAATISFKLMSTGITKLINWDGSRTEVEF